MDSWVRKAGIQWCNCKESAEADTAAEDSSMPVAIGTEIFESPADWQHAEYVDSWVDSAHTPAW